MYSSSASVYGTPKLTPTEEDYPFDDCKLLYGTAKVGLEYIAKSFMDFGLDIVGLRYFNVYGNRMSLEGAYKLVIPIFTEQRLNGKPMTINGDGEQRRDFTYVDDVVDANIKCAEYPLELNGDIFNIGNGDNRSVNQIANMIGGNIIHREPVIEPRETLANNEKAKNILGGEPTMLIEDWIPTWSVLKSEK